MIRFHTYDCGHGIMIAFGRRTARVHFGFPITPSAIRYSLRTWWRAYRCRKDIHDYFDAEIDERGRPAQPWHFYTYTCRHCGKKFEI